LDVRNSLNKNLSKKKCRSKGDQQNDFFNVAKNLPILDSLCRKMIVPLLYKKNANFIRRKLTKISKLGILSERFYDFINIFAEKRWSF
jgi:hypothetical protein